MKRLSFLFLFVCLNLNMAQAQRILSYEDLSDKAVTYDGDDDEAGVVLRCKSDLILDFDSNMDMSVNVYNIEKDTENNVATYYLIFTTGRRTLTIKANTYNPIDIPLDLKAHQLDVYRLYDPNDKIDGTYYQLHRERGQQYFDNCDYLSAREEFRLALNWNDITEFEEVEAQGLIANCDSILNWRRIGFEAADMMNLDKATEFLHKAQSLNPLDKSIVNKVFECDQMQTNRCKDYLEAGNRFFENKEYQDAIYMYKKVEERNCNETSLALSQRIMAETMIRGRKNLERYFGFEIGKTWGITYGTYRKITGGYITVSLNKYSMDLISSDYKPEDHAEFGVSFGWTFPVVNGLSNIFRGLWIHAGFGAAAYNRFKINNELTFGYDKLSISGLEEATGIRISSDNVSLSNDIFASFIEKVNESVESEVPLEAKDVLDTDMGFAITPEIGITVKIWHFAARVTYQHRYSLNTNFDKCFNPRFSFGVGFCW